MTPNAWFDDPRDLVAALRRIVHLSVETARIVQGLPAFPVRYGLTLKELS